MGSWRINRCAATLPLLIITVTLSILEPAYAACVPTTPPEGNTCGLRGRVPVIEFDPYEEFSSPQILDSVENCASLCFRRGPYCKSFKYNSDNRLCQLSFDKIDDRVKQNNNSTAVYNDIGCYDCGPRCSSPYGANLLDNGGFEQRLLGPWESSSDFVRQEGNRKVWHTHLTTSRISELRQSFDNCKGQYYGFRFDWKITPSTKSKTKKNFYIITAQLDTYGTEWYQTIRARDGPIGWETNIGFVKSSLYNSVFALFDFQYGNASVSIDNVSVFRVPPNLPTKPGSEVFQNSGFEDGKLRPWALISAGDDNSETVNATLVSPGIGSDYAVRFQADTYYGQAAPPALTQQITLKPNVGYLFRCSLNINKDNMYQIYVRVGGSINRFFFNSTGPKEIEVPVMVTRSTLPFDTFAVFVELDFQSRKAGVDVLADSFSLKEVDGSLLGPT